MQFSEIIGQKEVKERLVRSVKEERISHAQLFVGNQGNGSLPLALAYAQYITCQNKLDNDSCGTCSSCLKYEKLIHPDLHFVYPIALSKDCRVSTARVKEWREAFLDNPYITLSSWFESLDSENKQAIISVDESAEIIHKLNLTTYETDYKVMIIWHPEKMHPTAANKLLKILEEPPEKTIFILVCEKEEELLRTIVSRTQRVTIPKIDNGSLMSALIDLHQVVEENAINIASMADGSYSDALLLLNENESAEQNLLTFQQLMRVSIKFNPKEIMGWIDSISAAGRERQKSFLSYSLHIMRESLMLNNGASELMKVGESEKRFLEKFSPFIHKNNADRFVNELSKAHFEMERNANPKILYMDLAFKFNELLNLPK